jgi:His-Xaa-Ser system radical SAM maturase HxsC
MLVLATRNLELRGFDSDEISRHLLLCEGPATPHALRGMRAFLVRDAVPPPGFGAYVGFQDRRELVAGVSEDVPVVLLPAQDFSYLSEGDVLRVMPRSNAVRTVYRRSSHQNFILATERCNNYCLMCSQPPKREDDSWLVDDILRLLPLIDRATPEITVTGGEPTLLGEDLLKIVAACESWLPETAIHVLSNGRSFADLDYARRYAEVGHHDVMVGIPLYSDVSHLHDFVVQAKGAFDETVRGILNLKSVGARVEVRVVLHQQTYARLPKLAQFIARNLRFVDQVALMGLEMTGFTRANLAQLWMDPIHYRGQLEDAVDELVAHGVRTSIYNHQLCVLPERLWPFARKSISDWKNEYMPECAGCTKMRDCGGFFSSATLRYSDHIRPFLR